MIKGRKKVLPQEVDSFDETVDLATYRVEFRRNTRVQEVIKKRGWKEICS